MSHIDNEHHFIVKTTCAQAHTHTQAKTQSHWKKPKSTLINRFGPLWISFIYLFNDSPKQSTCQIDHRTAHNFDVCSLCWKLQNHTMTEKDGKKVSQFERASNLMSKVSPLNIQYTWRNKLAQMYTENEWMLVCTVFNTAIIIYHR